MMMEAMVKAPFLSAACFQSLKTFLVKEISALPLLMLKWRHGKQNVASLSAEYSRHEYVLNPSGLRDLFLFPISVAGNIVVD